TLRLRLMEQDPSGYREMVQVLLLHREFDPDLVQEAIQEALAAGTCHAEGIRQLLLNRLDGRREASALEPRGPAVPVGDPRRYDALLGAGARTPTPPCWASRTPSRP